MSLEAILAKIQNDAQEKAAGILEEAEKERKEALHKVKSRIKEQHHRDVERIKKKGASMAVRMKNHIEKETEQALLSHRRKLVDQAIRTAVEKTAEESGYLDLVGKLLSECDLKGEVEVIVCPEDRKRITAEFLKKHSTEGVSFVLSEETHQDHGGVIMRSGDISLNATLSMIAELNHDSMVMDLSRLLPLPGRGE